MSDWFKQRFADRFARPAKRTFFVYGVRRSGNHACINWLANALEAQSVRFMLESGSNHCSRSESGRTFFINTLAGMSAPEYRHALRRHRKAIANSDFLILSAEDKAGDYLDHWRIPSSAQPICVTRATLNVIASRFQRLNESAMRGQSERGMAMDSRFFDILRSNLHQPRGLSWHFDRWTADSEWRQQFLADLDLTFNLMPRMSREGGGSSFTGTGATPSPEDLASRFRMVQPAAAWRSFLADTITRQSDCFSDDEKKRVIDFLEDRSAD